MLEAVTERKPFGVSWETWIDRQIREVMRWSRLVRSAASVNKL